MNFSKHSLVASSLLLLLGMNSFADEVYTIQNKTLKEALEIISKKLNLSYIANDEVLDKKSTNNIQNIEGTQQALDKLLEGSGLKAIIDDKSIVIIQEQGNIKVVNGTYILDDVSVKGGKNGSADSGYLVEDVKTLGVWGNLSLQDTPYSMNVMSDDFLQNTITTNMAQVAKQNPLTQNTGGNSYNGDVSANIRGFGINALLIDGIYLPGSFYGSSLKEVDRVEIISGLSGFLYGAGNVGGTVNYALKYPKAKPFTEISVGNNGGKNYYTSVDTSQNITDKLSVRVNGNYQNGDTEIENNSIKEKLIGVSFAYKPTDNLDLGLYYSHREYKESGFTQWSITGKMPDAKDLDTSKAYAPKWSSNESDSDKVQLKANYSFTDSLRLRTAYIYKEASRLMPLQINNYNANTGLYSRTLMDFDKEKTTNHGAYAYLDGDFNTGFVHHSLTFGGSLSQEEYRRKLMIWTGDGTTFTDKNDFMNWNFSSTRPYDGTITARKNFNTNVVLGDNITFSEQWSALLGVNYASVENKTYNANNTLTPYGTKTAGYDESEFTPTLSLIYKPIEDLTTYITYIEALENGTVVGTTYINAGEVFAPLKSKQYEIGAKYSIHENLLLSSALFRIEKPNNMDENTPTGKKLTQDGELVREGIEILATGKATDNLTLMGGFNYVKPKVEKATNKALEGKEATNVAKYQAKMYAEYRLPIEPKIFLNGGVYYTGTQWVDSANTQKLPAYTTVDFGARYETKLEGYDTTFRIYASNITDEKYWENTSYLGDPRSVAFNVTLKF